VEPSTNTGGKTSSTGSPDRAGLRRERRCLFSGLGLFLFWPVPVGIEVIAWPAIGWAWVGFVAGGAFSTVLCLGDGPRGFDELSGRRMAAWGAMGGLLLGVSFALSVWDALPVFLKALNVGLVILLSSVCAARLLSLARRVDDRALLDADQKPRARACGKSAPSSSVSAAAEGWRSGRFATVSRCQPAHRESARVHE